MINYFNQTNRSKESFLSEEWPTEVLHIVHCYFRYFAECERNLALCSNYPEVDGLKDAMQFLEKQLSELNISFNELSNVFGQRVAALLFLSTNHIWTADNGALQKETISSRLVNTDKICLKKSIRCAHFKTV